jgi:hypothetical protein
VVDVGVTIYCTVPAFALLGLLSVWLMVLPEPALAPVIPPVIVPTVHVNELGALAARVILGFVPLHADTNAGLVTTGLGFTVTVIVNGAPTQPPVVDVGVTIYCTDPAVALLGLVSVWLIMPPPPAVAPVIPPVTAPIVHVKVLGALDVSVMFGLEPVHIEDAAAFVTAGLGLTVTVIVNGVPGQLPVIAVGVTIYCTEPAVALLGLVSVWLIVLPDPALAPVIPPEIVPIVHVKVLGALAVRLMFGLVALQIATAAALVTAGVGFTVTVIVYGAPTQPPVVDVGVTIYCTDPAVALLGLVSTWLMDAPEPALAPVMLPEMEPIVHENVLGVLAASVMFGLVPLQTATADGFVTAGVGLTVTVIVNGAPTQLPVVEVGVTMYSTIPGVELLGFVSTWLIVAPAPALAPVIPPVTAPIVHANVEGALAVRAMFGLVALQIAAAAGLVTAGLGLTVTVIV